MKVPPPKLRSEVRELGDNARELVKLTEHPSWSVLRSEIEERRDAYLAKLARQILAGGPEAPPVNDAEIRYIRGFFRGAQAVLDTPHNAVEALEAFLRKEQDKNG